MRKSRRRTTGLVWSDVIEQSTETTRADLHQRLTTATEPVTAYPHRYRTQTLDEIDASPESNIITFTAADGQRDFLESGDSFHQGTIKPTVFRIGGELWHHNEPISKPNGRQWPQGGPQHSPNKPPANPANQARNSSPTSSERS